MLVNTKRGVDLDLKIMTKHKRSKEYEGLTYDQLIQSVARKMSDNGKCWWLHQYMMQFRGVNAQTPYKNLREKHYVK